MKQLCGCLGQHERRSSDFRDGADLSLWIGQPPPGLMIFASPRYMRDCIYPLARSAPANEPYPGIVLTVVSSKLLSLPQAHLNTAAGQLAGTVSPVLQPVSLTLSFNTPTAQPQCLKYMQTVVRCPMSPTTGLSSSLSWMGNIPSNLSGTISDPSSSTR